MLYRWIDCLGLRREEIPAENVCSTGNDMSRAVPWCFGEAALRGVMEDYAPPERQPISVVADEVLQSEVGTEVGSGANSEVKEPTNEPSRRAEQAINDAAERLAGSGGREDSEDQSTADGTDQSAEEASAQTEAPNEAETVITETNSSDEVNVTGSEDVALKSSEVVSDEAKDVKAQQSGQWRTPRHHPRGDRGLLPCTVVTRRYTAMAQSRLKAARADWARSAGGLDLAGDFRTKHKDGLAGPADAPPPMEVAPPPHTLILYVAPLLAFGLVFLYGYRRCFKLLEDQLSKLFPSHPAPHSLEEPLVSEASGEGGASGRSWLQRGLECLLALFHYYTLLYVVCGYLIWDEYKSSFRLLKSTHYLAPENLKDRFLQETEPLPNWWQDEVKHMVDPGGFQVLRRFTLLSPLFLALTFLVSLGNTLRHVWRMLRKGGLLKQNPGIDSSIMIIALPMIACMMSYRSVTRMWMICANSKVGSLGYVEDFQGNRTWVARLVVCQNMYETNFLLTDLYESWALLHFANLALQIIASRSTKPSRASVPQPAARASQTVMSLQEKLTESVDALTKQGIYLFNGTCFLEAAYSLFTTSVEAYLGGDRTLKFNERVYRSRTRVHYFFLGMGAIASSAAIGNVVTVEMTFEKQLETFRPSAKFWSTKILLSIGFIQTLLLEVPPLSTSLSITEKESGVVCGVKLGGLDQSVCTDVHRFEHLGDAEKHGGEDHDEDEEVESPAKSGGKVLVGLTIFLGTVLMLVAIGSAAYMAYQRRRAGPAEQQAPLRDGAAAPAATESAPTPAAEAPATEADATAPSFSGPEAGA
ncbi:unnamed protein product [Durusdinium trenchii]|uniref:Transmembrane protein n=1 Tax=Durusdinium trenchii TaxID=1381693 RepID=A0ABP0SSR0_9DINO